MLEREMLCRIENLVDNRLNLIGGPISMIFEILTFNEVTQCMRILI